MLNKTVMHGENGTLIGQNGIVKLAGKWIELESILLSEAIQAQNDRHCKLSLI